MSTNPKQTEEGGVKGGKLDGYPDFGRAMLKDFQFEDGYLNMNNGSYGTIPRPVSVAKEKLRVQIEGNPDRFMKRDWLPLLNDAREKSAGIIGAKTEECVIVPNTTHGVNTILHNIKWTAGDRIVIFSTTYGAVQQMMKFYCDMNPEINLDIINLTFPCSHAKIINQTEELLGQWNELNPTEDDGQHVPKGKKEGGRVRLVVVDSIASNPGMVLPWEKVVEVCRKYGVLSLVDGAHSIGQHKVDVGASKCDFFVTNAHKWLYAPRSAAIMYVPLRNQNLVKSSFPVSAAYNSTRYPYPQSTREWGFGIQYEWNGTCDWTNFLSIGAGIQWRKDIGGEERIMEYCHSLAVEGGKRIAEKWGTKVMENEEGSLTAAMVNVELPDVPPPKDFDDTFQQMFYMEKRMFDLNARFMPYVHDGRWWGRFSAQIWLELDDFDRIAELTRCIMIEIQDGKHLDVEPAGNDTLQQPEDVLLAEK